MKINIVIPCYNEQEVLAKTIDVLGKLSERIKQETGADIQLLLVDDGRKKPYLVDDQGGSRGSSFREWYQALS